MWVIQQQLLIRLPDNVPLPPGSVQVEVPDDFLAHPEAYKIEQNQLVKQSGATEAAARSQPRREKLTREEVLRLKQAIAEGRL